jgi:hypothetical protein
MTTTFEERLQRLERTDLKHGAHASIEQGACAMEMLSYLADEPWSDHPACASPMLAAFLRTWNDHLQTDEDRNRLIRPLLPLLLDTRQSVDIENRRAMRVYDWLVRVFTPAWLELHPELTEHATALRALAPLVDEQAARAAQPVSEAASNAASAAWSAAGSAARSAARSAAESAAWSAVKPTAETLQVSAQELIRELCAMGREAA